MNRDPVAELAYWRSIRLDCPDRKQEAMNNIDAILDEILNERDTKPASR